MPKIGSAALLSGNLKGSSGVEVVHLDRPAELSF
jgi:hypothetical protein